MAINRGTAGDPRRPSALPLHLSVRKTIKRKFILKHNCHVFAFVYLLTKLLEIPFIHSV